MALPNNPLLDEVEVWAYLADVTTGTPAAFTVSPIKGEIIRLKATRHATLAGSDNVITVKVNGTAITGGTITMATAADAAGDTDEVIITNPGITARVVEGDSIGFFSGGEADNATVPTMFTAVIRNRRN